MFPYCQTVGTVAVIYNLESLWMKIFLIKNQKDLETVVQQGGNAHANILLGQILLRGKLLSSATLEKCLKRQKNEDKGKHLGRILTEQGVVNAWQVKVALAYKFGIACVRLDEFDIAPRTLSLVKPDIALQYNVLPLGVVDGRLAVLMEDPLDEKRIELLRFNTKLAIEPLMCSAKDLSLALSKYYSSFDESDALDDMEIVSDAEIIEMDLPGSDQTIEQQAKAKPIVRLLNALVHHGVMSQASDINIRPQKDRIDVYYRIDGKLHYSRTLNKSLLAALVSRIKIVGRMNIAERRLPQDGRSQMVSAGKSVDLRISIIPTVSGESVVIRILDKEGGVLGLDDLGLSEKEHAQLKQLLVHPHGIFLVTGPTGSGKSTTLYAIIQEINKRKPHILTVEDPVEYDIEDIEQVQVSNEMGYTFAKALRNFLRHDPDVIMVGEIRDEETAHIANKAALTGHLVLSTLHTNDASSTITRLIDMGVEPYLLSSTLLGVMAQRLVRLNCTRCLMEDEIKPSVRKKLGLKEDEIFWKGQGCPLCTSTGYKGRANVCELLTVTPEISRYVSEGSTARTIRERAISDGMVPLVQNAIELARRGLTSIEEVYAIGFESESD